MFDIPFNAEAFPSYVARRGVLHCDESDMAHALFVTGRAPGDQSSYGSMSVWEWIHRSSLVPAYLRRSTSDRLMKSALADALDRSEKVALSYALGQAMTGIFCGQNLGVTHLMHVDRYAARWRVTFGTMRRRPDLFGRIGPARWVVAEAKGRSNRMESDLRQTLISQKGTVRTVAGHTPFVALGCVASFPSLGAVVRGPLRVDLNEQLFFQTYYEPFAAAIDAGQPMDGPPGYITGSFQAAGLRVGLRQDLYEAVQSGRERVSAPWTELIDGIDASNERPDGTFVQADYGESIFVQDYDG